MFESHFSSSFLLGIFKRAARRERTSDVGVPAWGRPAFGEVVGGVLWVAAHEPARGHPGGRHAGSLTKESSLGKHDTTAAETEGN